MEFPEQSVSSAIKEWQKFLDMLGTPVPCHSNLKTISFSFHGRIALTTAIMQTSRRWAKCAVRLLTAEAGIAKARNSSRVINQIIKKVNSKAIINEPAPGDVVPSGHLDSSEVKLAVTSILMISNYTKGSTCSMLDKGWRSAQIAVTPMASFVPEDQMSGALKLDGEGSLSLIQME